MVKTVCALIAVLERPPHFAPLRGASEPISFYSRLMGPNESGTLALLVGSRVTSGRHCSSFVFSL